MAGSKAAKIWRRTWIGASMVLVVALILWLASLDSSGRVMLFGGFAIALLAVLEVSRMGKLDYLGLAPRLFPALLLALCFGLATRHVPEPLVRRIGAPEPEPLYAPSYLLELSACLALAAVVHAAASLSRSNRRGLTALGLGSLGIGLAYAGQVLLAPAAVRGELYLSLLGAGVLSFGYHLRHEEETRRLGVLLFFTAWLVLPLLWLQHLFAEVGMAGVVAVLLLSKVGDTAGYFVGNAIGRSHPFPSISPGKTTAGCVASLVAGIATGIAVVAAGWLPDLGLGLPGGALVGAAINLAAQAGDLLESAVKRRAGVKDSGTWFGPAGGVLDVIDSLLLTVPTALLLI